MNIVITGGASGLGEAITRTLAKDTANVVYFSYNNSLSNAIKIEKDFYNTHSIKCDFKNVEEVNSLKNKIDTMDLDVLINNAFTGNFIETYFHKTSPDVFSSGFNNNIIPAIILTQAAINHFRKKKKGKIITILTSGLLNNPPIGASVYLANKAYLSSLTKIWATENAKFNITSNSVSPAFMLTNLTKDTDERVIEQMIEKHPLKKLLTIEEVAETVLFLVNASPQINGIDIAINSGVNIK